MSAPNRAMAFCVAWRRHPGFSQYEIKSEGLRWLLRTGMLKQLLCHCYTALVWTQSPFLLFHCWNCWNKPLLQTTIQPSILLSHTTQGMSVWFSLKRLLIPFSAANVKWRHLIAKDTEPQISCLMTSIRKRAPLKAVPLSRANFKCIFFHRLM